MSTYFRPFFLLSKTLLTPLPYSALHHVDCWLFNTFILGCKPIDIFTPGLNCGLWLPHVHFFNSWSKSWLEKSGHSIRCVLSNQKFSLLSEASIIFIPFLGIDSYICLSSPLYSYTWAHPLLLYTWGMCLCVSCITFFFVVFFTHCIVIHEECVSLSYFLPHCSLYQVLTSANFQVETAVPLL